VKTIEAEARSTGSPQAVWALLEDASRWTQWGSWSKVYVEGGGAQGVGAVRVLHRRPFKVRERITEWVPGERMGYELLDGMNVRGYRSTVTIEPDGEGSVVRWRSTYESSGALTGAILRAAVPDSCKRVAKAADR
jgi:uncharacterized protein YndB with AHSA1/START domain